MGEFDRRQQETGILPPREDVEQQEAGIFPFRENATLGLDSIYRYVRSAKFHTPVGEAQVIARAPRDPEEWWMEVVEDEIGWTLNADGEAEARKATELLQEGCYRVLAYIEEPTIRPLQSGRYTLDFCIPGTDLQSSSPTEGDYEEDYIMADFRKKTPTEDNQGHFEFMFLTKKQLPELRFNVSNWPVVKQQVGISNGSH